MSRLFCQVLNAHPVLKKSEDQQGPELDPAGRLPVVAEEMMVALRLETQVVLFASHLDKVL